MEQTENLQLDLPAYEDEADVEVLNENFKKLDKSVSSLQVRNLIVLTEEEYEALEVKMNTPYTLFFKNNLQKR